MAFKMKPCSVIIDNTPIYTQKLEDGVMAEANRNGSILLSENLTGKDIKKAVAHEKVHLDQMERGDLDYDNNNVYWKGKKYPRSTMVEGAKNLPWEKEAYRKA